MKSLGYILGEVWAYPFTSSDKVMATVDRRTEQGKKYGKRPDCEDTSGEGSLGDLSSHDDRVPSMKSNGEDKEPRRHVADLNQPALGETCHRRAVYPTDGQPVDTDEKGERLLEVAQKEVVYENDVLTVVVTAPDESICNPSKEKSSRDDGEESEYGHGDKSSFNGIIEKIGGGDVQNHGERRAENSR
jgi:hypothetical protein